MDSLFRKIDSSDASFQKNDDFEFSFSTVRSSSDNLPQRQKLPLVELYDTFKIPDQKRGTLSFDEYHALDPKNPAAKVKRDQEKNGLAIIPVSAGLNPRLFAAVSSY